MTGSTNKQNLQFKGGNIRILFQHTSSQRIQKQALSFVSITTTSYLVYREFIKENHCRHLIRSSILKLARATVIKGSWSLNIYDPKHRAKLHVK